jgi:hypothetical protein
MPWEDQAASEAAGVSCMWPTASPKSQAAEAESEDMVPWPWASKVSTSLSRFPILAASKQK